MPLETEKQFLLCHRQEALTTKANLNENALKTCLMCPCLDPPLYLVAESACAEETGLTATAVLKDKVRSADCVPASEVMSVRL